MIRGARVHNLQNVDVEIPRNQFTVVTGVSGSGKSSLTMDTLYAEGQRRYVESLSAYARQFMMRMDKPDVDAIHGICPAIALEQRVSSRNTRSTVGSMTEIYDYLRLLFARVGKTYSPVSGEEVRRHEPQDVIEYLKTLPEGTRVQLLSPLQNEYERDLGEELNLLLQKGYSRILAGKELRRLDEYVDEAKWNKREEVALVVDRFACSDDADLWKRVSDSVQVALNESFGYCTVDLPDSGERKAFSTRFELDGMRFELPSDALFNFNNPYGACKRCEGYGSIIGIDPDLVIPNRSLSVYDTAVQPWRGPKMKAWLRQLLRGAEESGFPVHRPVKDLSPEEEDVLWDGTEHFKGIWDFFDYLEEKAYKIQFRVMLSRYRGRTACTECGGSRIRKEAQYVKIQGMDLATLMQWPIRDIWDWMESLDLDARQQKIAGRIFPEIRQRLGFMLDVGLGYLDLNRRANTLSGGETQRINLTRQLGSNLTSSLYILDEPSVGLHPRDTARLLKVLARLRDLGNTVVVVEHEEDVMKSADHIIDMGPLAGVFGGQVIAEGNYAQITANADSLTGAYLSGREEIEVPAVRRPVRDRLELRGCRQFNLKDIDVTIPLNMLVAVSGVSGSGKTTLVKKILVPALSMAVMEFGDKAGEFDGLEGDFKRLKSVEMVDQNPIGKSSRSNPVTYVKAYDTIRDLFSKQPASKVRGLKPKHFSFNVDGGRCDTCKGEGETIVEMQFLADVHLPCEDCSGKRFKSEILEVKYKSKNISDVLQLSVDEAIKFFAEEKDVVRKLSPLAEVGLGYVKLGQSASTLSGGEAQRVKLASFLGKGKNADPVFFVFDEPTTGLHFNDIRKLLNSFQALIERGHTVLVVEHNLDVLKCADYIIDLGPEGGEEGGHLVFQGTPEALAECPDSYTGVHLAEKI